MENSEINKTVAKKDPVLTICYVVIVAVTLIICSVAFKLCSYQEPPNNSKPKYDYKSEQKDNDKINHAIHKDSILTVTKIKYIHHYHTVYDSLIVTDTLCQQSLITLYNAFGDLNNANDSIIRNDSILITTLFDKVNTKQSHITLDSSYIVRLQDSIPKVKRRSFWHGVGKGAIIGAVVVESVNVIGKLKP